MNMAPKEQDVFDLNYLLDSLDTITESVENHFENVARSLQDAFRQTPWLPESVKPRPAPPARSVLIIQPPLGYLEASRRWINDHRAVTAAVVAFVGTGIFIVWRRRRADRTKRRARRARTGARTEIVIISGSPLSPLTRSLSLDFERRGFVVYIPVSTLSEEQIIQTFSRSDIRPLSLDITSPSSTEETVRKLHTFLTTPQHPTPQTPPNIHSLTAFIHVPSGNHYAEAITALKPSHWSDILTTHLLAPFTTISAFLPLLIAQKSTLLFLSPSISSALCPPDHATESVVAGAMSKYVNTLRHELSPQGLNVAELKLGQFDLGGGSPAFSSTNASEKEREKSMQLSQRSGSSHSNTMNFHQPTRAEYTKYRLTKPTSTQSATSSGANPPPPRATNIKRLHKTIFDVIERRTGVNGTTFVGRGARTYDLVGRWVPEGVVGWMMGRAKMPILDSSTGGSSTTAKAGEASKKRETEKGKGSVRASLNGLGLGHSADTTTANAASMAGNLETGSSEGSAEWEKLSGDDDDDDEAGEESP